MEQSGYSYGCKTEAYQEVAKRVKVNERTIFNWVDSYEKMLFVKKSSRGKHSKTRSPIIDNLEFKAQFEDYVKNNNRNPGEPEISETKIAFLRPRL